MENARRLASYVDTAIATLAGLDEVTLLGAAWTFPLPAETDNTTRQKRS